MVAVDVEGDPIVEGGDDLGLGVNVADHHLAGSAPFGGKDSHDHLLRPGSFCLGGIKIRKPLLGKVWQVSLPL